MRTPPSKVWVNAWCTDNDNPRPVGISFCELMFVNEEDVMEFTEAHEEMLPDLEEFPSLTVSGEARARLSTPREVVYAEPVAEAQVPAPFSPRGPTSSVPYGPEPSTPLVPGRSAPLEPTMSLRPRGGSAGAGRGPVSVDVQEAPAQSVPSAPAESVAGMEAEAEGAQDERGGVLSLEELGRLAQEQARQAVEGSPGEETDQEEVLISPLISGEQMVDLLAGSRPSSDYAAAATRIRAGIALVFPEEADALKRLYVPDDLLV